ncbi:hypothetical protein Glove_585g18 [Diversispora epigaea]|uniref:Uncharacterized protein n=1 Tax=Diversispora epigaea TaxID=1348612 RepID=A0A397G9V1_9GLOM|nr:hypothetical protein Glove_585g18 [Diversispora epigaea]
MCFFLLLITIFYVFFTLKVLFFIINSHKFLVETQLEITVQRAAQVILEQRVSELEKKSNEKYDELLFENTILRITLIIHKKHITELTTLNDNDNNNDNYDETYNRILKQIEKMKTQCKNSLNSPTISRLPIIKSRKLGSISSIPITHKSS